MVEEDNKEDATVETEEEDEKMDGGIVNCMTVHHSPILGGGKYAIYMLYICCSTKTNAKFTCRIFPPNQEDGGFQSVHSGG